MKLIGQKQTGIVICYHLFELISLFQLIPLQRNYHEIKYKNLLKANLKMLKVNKIDDRNTYRLCPTLHPSIRVCFLRLVLFASFR